jgi:hypothetical protein
MIMTQEVWTVYLPTNNLYFLINAEIIFDIMEFSDFKCILYTSLKEKEFNSAILWLRITLLSIFAHPLFVLFSGYEQDNLGGRDGI